MGGRQSPRSGPPAQLLKMAIFIPKKRMWFNAFDKRRGVRARACPCVALRVTSGIVEAVDSDGNERIFYPNIWRFEAFEAKRKVS